MKKYIITVLVIAALVVIALCLMPGQQKSTMASSEEDAIAFYGVAVHGRTVTACMEPYGYPCRSTNATGENWYILRLPTARDWWGFYTVDDGQHCTPHVNMGWNGHDGWRADFCGNPNPSFCPCN